MQNLTEREATVLTAIIHAHTESAGPIGSRTLAKQYLTEFSPATIRNTMSDLEDMGFLEKPHTSAGREPTESGYRAYVDDFMSPPRITQRERNILNDILKQSMTARDADMILGHVARALATISHQIGVAFLPSFDLGIFQRIELVPLAEHTVLAAIQVTGGPVRTVTLELDEAVERSVLDETAAVLNERLAGLTVGQIRSSIAERLRDVSRGDSRVISIFLQEGREIFDLDARTNVHMEGRPNILGYPEFADRARLTEFMSALDEGDLYAEVRERDVTQEIAVSIGQENRCGGLASCSLVMRGYQQGPLSGTLAIVGPMRMPYRKVVAALNHAGQLIESLLR